ncbi:hypothetical protein A7K73_04935 [Candidatus Methylacidiphilum fumarolicum]|nr:hypothetical protein A7K73_04935 [Candidatus Methylacidiphilum fumarolicum]
MKAVLFPCFLPHNVLFEDGSWVSSAPVTPAGMSDHCGKLSAKKPGRSCLETLLEATEFKIWWQSKQQLKGIQFSA